MTTEQKIIKTKVGILDLAKQLGNVSQACKTAITAADLLNDRVTARRFSRGCE